MAKTSPGPSSEKTQAPAKGNDGVISWLFNIVLGGNDPERDKRRQLKQLAKDFGHVRYKFYKPKSSQAQPSLAKFFYECYRITSNASVILQNSEKSAALKTLCIEFFLEEQQLATLERFTEDAIRERSRSADPKTLAAELKDELVSFFASFDNARVSRINETYTLINRFVRFINFDFYFILKKFDSGLQERSFGGTPKFEAINAEYILDDIKDFQEVAMILDKQEDWGSVFDVLKQYKGLDPIDRGEWARILNIIHQVNISDILSMIVRHAAEDPYYKSVGDRSVQRIVEPYIEKTRSQVEAVIQKIASEKRDMHIDKLLVAVFGTKDVNRTKYYTDTASQIFSKKLKGNAYSYTAPINYMKAFLLDYFKKDVRELQELILVRGKWTSNVLSQQLSDVYYQVLAISDQIITFDESLAEEAENGQRLRKAMGRVVDRDANTVNGLRQTLQEINERAAKLVNDGAQALITFGKYLRSALEDIDKKDHEIIINWKELEGMTEIPMKTRMAEVYKKLYYFIQLLQVFARSGGKGPSSQSGGVDIPEEESV